MRSALNPVLLGVATVLWLLLLIPVGIGAMMSPMIFDSGESGYAWTLFVLIALTPILILVAIAVSWVAFGFNRTRLAWAVMAAPLAWLAIVAAVLFKGG